MSDDLGFPHKHGDIAWNHWLAQHIGKRNTEDFVYSFYQPFKILDDVLNELYTKRTIDTAEGSALGGCGNIVGLSRIAPNEIWLEFFGFVTQVSGRAFGVARMRHHNEAYTATNVLGDPEYRSRIKAKIWLNNGHGTAEECYAALSESLDVDIIFIIDIGNANANLYIGEVILSNDPRFHIIDEMIPRAAGVKFWVYMTGSKTFGFENQKVYYGFEVGTMAMMMESAIIPIPP